jgi:phosphoribosylformimino-5-aminoimidazole carboxamide ribotide isomerase
LETVQGPDVLEAACSHLGPDRVVFSLDLKNGLPWGDTTSWGVSDPWSVASQAIRLGVRRLLILDLVRVGVGGGLGTEELCARLAAAYPQVHLAAGGGVRDSADLDRLRESGVGAVLVASALHDSRLPREVIDKFQESNHEIEGG